MPTPCGSKPPIPENLKDLAVLLAARPVEGQPISVFEQFQSVSGASEFAAAVLCDKDSAQQWSNAIYALGAIGDQKAKASLEKFIRDPKDPLTGKPLTFNAKIDTLFAIGYMALHSPDEHVKAGSKLFLDRANGVSAELWREIQWESPYHATNEARNAYLASKVRAVIRAMATQNEATTPPQPPALASRKVAAHQ